MGRIAVVTGASAGIGEMTALGLARTGAHVVIACRSTERGTAAVDRLRRLDLDAGERTTGVLEVRELDLSDLGSVRRFCAAWDHERLDLLVNNAGIALAPFRRTVDGFESHLGVNHLGPFALTGLLLPHLLRSSAPRVVTVTSEAQRFCRFRLEQLGAERRDRKAAAYLRSKRANLYFATELQRKADAGGVPLVSVAVGPGLTKSHILHSDAHAHHGRRRLMPRLLPRIVGLVGKPTELGAAPSLYAATDPDVPGGSYVVPGGPLQQRGDPVLRHEPAMDDVQTARRLWEFSEEATGVRYPLAGSEA